MLVVFLDAILDTYYKEHIFFLYICLYTTYIEKYVYLYLDKIILIKCKFTVFIIDLKGEHGAYKMEYAMHIHLVSLFLMYLYFKFTKQSICLATA